jgi:hypothetical protein
MYELLDETTAQVVLAVDPGDSIREVSQHIQRPYETVRQAVNRLEESGFVEYDDGLWVRDGRVRDAARDLLASSAAVSPPTIEEAYVLPQFGDWPYAFTSIDAVYVWTQGGFQIARSPDDYPVFIAVKEGDTGDWRAFFEAFDIPVALERQDASATDGALQFVLEPRSDLKVAEVDGHPVIPRDEAIEFMQENRASFQSALSELDRMYDDLDLN